MLDDLRDADLATFADNLRAAGFEDRFVRGIINAEIDERFREQEEALAPDRPKLPYWQHDDYEEPLEKRLARLDLEREKARLRRETLGPEDTKEADIPFAQEKWQLAKMISEDYYTIIAGLKQPFDRMVLPAEQEMMDRLEAEKRTELEALLTPEELAEYEFRTSNLFGRLKYGLGNFNTTEEEFRTIYAVIKEQDESIKNARSASLSKQGETDEDRIAEARARSLSMMEAKQHAKDELHASLGEERYADYERERDFEYKGLRKMVERMGLPDQAAKQVYELRQTAARESERIGDDYSQSVAKRKEALAALAQSTTHQIQSILGKEGTNAFLNSTNGFDWIRHLESGLIISFDADGGRSARGISEELPPATPSAP